MNERTTSKLTVECRAAQNWLNECTVHTHCRVVNMSDCVCDQVSPFLIILQIYLMAVLKTLNHREINGNRQNYNAKKRRISVKYCFFLYGNWYTIECTVVCCGWIVSTIQNEKVRQRCFCFKIWMNQKHRKHYKLIAEFVNIEFSIISLCIITSHHHTKKRVPNWWLCRFPNLR